MRGLVIWVVAGCSFHGPTALGPAGDAPDRDGPVDTALHADVAGDTTVPLDVDVIADVTLIAPDAAPAIDAPATCDLANFLCGNAPKAVTCDGHCWASCIEAIDLPTAKQRCAVWGGHVGFSDGAADDTCIAGPIFGQNYASWIGIEQAQDQATPATGWAAPDGTSYTNWAALEPRDGTDMIENNEDNCAYASTTTLWHAQPCSTLFKWSCRR